MEWKIAFPLHPEYRTLPMVWYVPPLSPIQNVAERGHIGFDGEIPDIASLRVPVKYLANLLTAGKEQPVIEALQQDVRDAHPHARPRGRGPRRTRASLEQAGLSQAQVDEMYRYLALADYEDRFVIPTSHREVSEDAYEIKGGCGFSFGNGCSGGGRTEPSLFGSPEEGRPRAGPGQEEGGMISFKALGALLDYPTPELAGRGRRDRAGAGRRARDRRRRTRGRTRVHRPASARRHHGPAGILDRPVRPLQARSRSISTSTATARAATAARRWSTSRSPTA